MSAVPAAPVAGPGFWPAWMASVSKPWIMQRRLRARESRHASGVHRVTREEDAERREAFVGRVVASMIGTFDLAAMFIGERLGLYRTLAGGPATPAGLAQRAGGAQAYGREWLGAQ